MTFVADDAALERGDGGFPGIVPVAGRNWASQEAESTAEERLNSVYGV
ncbi:hypothetical protein [Streptomyces broussonetiae]|uniref:Uncharacterized protein n=1 Tax=Streptomyces broussonetiae TaxID=2686304 RepID=A0A6I6NHP2_9ACTN|nr:hypothetical protein [Streptomyces broussonetiae]QHA07736.1 hypothetical protein GQF42_34480 [Streptomyces broussonetiae]